MGILKIWQDGQCTQATFTGTSLLSQVLIQERIVTPHPCGGRGVCGKCAVRAQGELSELTQAERQANTRLSCQTRLLGDAQVWLKKTQSAQIETDGGAKTGGEPAGTGFGCAIDIGTTTLALKLFDLETCTLLSTQTALNPQGAVAADVIGRIGAAMEGQGSLLREMLCTALEQMIQDACKAANLQKEQLHHAVITGNTTMLYLLTGRNPACLSHAPFHADTLFGVSDTLLGMEVYYPHCMNAFVGADITCAVLASGMHLRNETALLCDIGTNGELALWKAGKLFVTSTAAGPAFEGAGISCGCSNVQGAIERVTVCHGEIHCNTIGDVQAVGLCGSGLIDAIACFLETQQIDETGAVEKESLPLRDGVALLPKDVRAVQLAKAAIAAGIQTLLEMAHVDDSEIQALYIAGGFGSHLNVASAAAIGLIPKALKDRGQILGNAALTGAVQLLLDRGQITACQELASHASHLNLGGNPVFNQNYMEQMLFLDEEPAEDESCSIIAV